MENQPPVSIITVNYNHGHYLAGYIQSLRQSNYPIAEIIIVDNASTDNSLDILGQYSCVTVIANNTNIGYSAALNQAMAAASHPLVCATGPDISVEPTWLEPLVERFNSNPVDIFVVSSLALSTNRQEIQSEGSSLHFSGHLCVYSMWEPASEIKGQEREVGAIDSTSALFDREKFLMIGGCDTDFFVYHEEFDYCYRARMRGWKCWYEPRSVVYHGDGSQEFSVRSEGEYPRRRPFLHTRNRLLSMLKNYQVRTLFGLLPILFVLEVVNWAMLARLDLQDTYIEAVRWLWSHRKEIILKRYSIQRNRILSDKALLTAEPLTITPLLLQSTRLRFAKKRLDTLLALYWWIMKSILYKRVI